MFRRAYSVASKFTLPLIISTKYIDERVECGIGSFILLNNSGWVLTAAHMMMNMIKAQEDSIKLAEYNQNKMGIENNPTIDQKTKRKRINELIKDNNWITNQSYWWAHDTFMIDEYRINQFKDIAIAHITNFTEAPGQIYPVFSITNDNNIGESVCKLGFPLHEVKATFDVNTNGFVLAPNTVPVPRFPIEGMLSRYNLLIDENGNTTKCIETTSPGLRGQSGGPIFNTNGDIYAMQVRTQHYALGFNPELLVNGKHIVEHQFLNTGVGISSEDIITFCRENGVQINANGM